MKYRKTALIEAVQWFKMGDHPAVILKAGQPDEFIPWCPTLEGGHVVTPGDWIATGVQGENWPIKPDVFAATYEPAAPPTAGGGLDREAVARIIEPDIRWSLDEVTAEVEHVRAKATIGTVWEISVERAAAYRFGLHDSLRAEALAKADAILALTATEAPDTPAGGE